MQSQSSLKREFLKKWVMGLEKCSSLKENNMGVVERKKAIKLSADLAMASTRNATTSWSRALIAKASIDNKTGSLAKRILDSSQTTATTTNSMIIRNNFNTKKIVIMSRKIRNNSKKLYAPRVRAKSMAKRLVKKRTQILKGLVPGGEYMDEYSLIKEALDYIVSLRAQVDVMHHLANSPHLIMNDNNM